MRKVINSTFITLDGVVENPQDWPSSDVGDDAAADLQLELLSASDAILMGRKTYGIFAPAWAARSGDPYSDRMNGIAKIVGSSTLADPTWNNTTVTQDVVKTVQLFKEQPGGHLIQFGFGPVTRTLMDNGLIDELHLWVHPVMVGGHTGDLLFRTGLRAQLTPVAATTFKTGVVLLAYRFGGSTSPH